MKRSIEFYKTESGRVPIEEFFDTLSDRVVQKIIAVIELVETERIIPVKFFKKLTDTELYECRIQWQSNIYRLFCFFDRNNKVVVTNGFAKKTQKTPQREIDKAKNYRGDYLNRRKP